MRRPSGPSGPSKWPEPLTAGVGSRWARAGGLLLPGLLAYDVGVTTVQVGEAAAREAAATGEMVCSVQFPGAEGTRLLSPVTPLARRKVGGAVRRGGGESLGGVDRLGPATDHLFQLPVPSPWLPG